MFAERAPFDMRPANRDEYALWFLTARVVRVITAAGSLAMAVSGTAAASSTVTPAAATISAGAQLIFTVVNDPTPTQSDWLGLYQTSAPDGAYLAWQFMNGLTTPPPIGLSGATLRFSAPLLPGTYEVRFFSNGTYARLATSSTVTVTGLTASVTPVAATVSAGASLGFVVAGGPGNAADWVGLYRTSTPNSAYLAWQYLNGLATAPTIGISGATLQFVAPSTPGTYEVRFFSDNSYTRLSTSSTVTVTAAIPSVTPIAPTVSVGTSIGVVVGGGPANAADWVALYRTSTPDTAYLAWQYLNGTTTPPLAGVSGATLLFPTTAPGTFEVRFFSNASYTRLATSSPMTVTAIGPGASVTLTSATARAGTSIGFVVAGGPASATDWAGLYRTSTSDSAYLAWQYLNGTTTAPLAGVSAAALQFPAPTVAGTYEVRLFSNATYARLATSGAVTVVVTASVTISTATVTAAPIKFVVAGGPANPTDWVGLYSTSSSDIGYIAWQYLNGATTAPTVGTSGASLWFPAPATPGAYEVRLFSNHTFMKLATSGPATVNALPAPASQFFVTGLSAPVGFVQDPVDPTVQYVVEQTGRIRVVKSGVLQSIDFIDLSSQINFGGEQGLLGLAFPPDYGTSHRFYVSFTGPNGNVVARFTHAANRLVANVASRLDLRWSSTGLRYIEQPFGNHNGGNIAFGPDGYLYVARGDGGSGNDPFRNAQNRATLLGKMLRIDVNVSDADPNGYVVPPDNPFVGASPTLSEIWAFGLRNPWRFSFDDGPGGTGALVIGDVGQNAYEEVDYELPNNGGRNYGWVQREGFHQTPGIPVEAPAPGAPSTFTDPVFEYPHEAGISITGGFVYRGGALGSAFIGRYFFADLSGRVWSFAIDAQLGVIVSNLVEHTATLGFGLVSAFGRDAAGELYIVEYDSGAILKITP